MQSKCGVQFKIHNHMRKMIFLQGQVSCKFFDGALKAFAGSSACLCMLDEV